MENITIKEVNQLVASDGEECNYFGRSVALSSNGLVCIVVAYFNNTKGFNAGKAYTYSRDSINDNWKEVNQLTASDGKPRDYFGSSVALSGDGLVAIVGAFGSDTKATNAGKVYTYSRATIDDEWVEVNQLVASDGKPSDYFGESVALSSDGLVAIVGARRNDTKASNAGKVYTYSRDSISDDWVEVNQLLASDGVAYDYFGSSVALSSDGLVAIVGADGKATDGGKVYTYSRDSITDNWEEINQLVASDDEARGYFGSSVALSSDGLVAIVGADGKATDGGKVYTYSRDSITDNWEEIKQLTASDAEDFDRFGSSVALSGGDIVVMVGADGSDTKAYNAGKVYTYNINSSKSNNIFTTIINKIRNLIWKI